MDAYSRNQSPGLRLFLVLLAISLLVLADQWTKWYVSETLLPVRAEGAAAPAFQDWFFTGKQVLGLEAAQATFRTLTLSPNLNFVMVWNKGISFGLMDQGGPLVSLGLMAMSMMASLALLIWFMVARGKIISVALPLIIGGAVGNVIDRIRFQAVADFVDAHLGDTHWPAFNLADSCIVLGALLLAISIPGHGKASA
jgi:signal peptidase II